MPTNTVKPKVCSFLVPYPIVLLYFPRLHFQAVGMLPLGIHQGHLSAFSWSQRSSRKYTKFSNHGNTTTRSQLEHMNPSKLNTMAAKCCQYPFVPCPFHMTSVIPSMLGASADAARQRQQVKSTRPFGSFLNIVASRLTHYVLRTLANFHSPSHRFIALIAFMALIWKPRTTTSQV